MRFDVNTIGSNVNAMVRMNPEEITAIITKSNLAKVEMSLIWLFWLVTCFPNYKPSTLHNNTNDTDFYTFKHAINIRNVADQWW